MDLAKNYNISQSTHQSEGTAGEPSHYVRTVFTVGTGTHYLSNYYGSDSCEETVFPSVEGLIYYMEGLRIHTAPDFIICLESLERADIKQLATFLKNSETYSTIPLILLAEVDKKGSRRDIIKLGIDDFVTGSISRDLFFERIKMISITKKNAQKNLGPEFQLSLEDYRINPFKRTSDIFMSGMLLLFLSPALLLLAILIKLESKGPVFYISQRAGGGYKIFNFYKLRSMADGADREMKRVIHLNNYGEGNKMENEIFYKIKGDPRVTRIGAFIRRTSIDELPQLFNVLKGDMSIVGNRPLPLYEAKQLTKDNWAARFNAPAGITGLWQVAEEGKDNLSAEQRLKLDIDYSENISFSLDMKILAKTFRAIIQKANH